MELLEKVGIMQPNLSILKQGKAKAIKLSTLDSFVKCYNVNRGIFWNINRNRRLNTLPQTVSI